MPVLPSYRNQSIDLLVVRQKAFDAPQSNQLTGFYMRATLPLNGQIRIWVPVVVLPKAAANLENRLHQVLTSKSNNKLHWTLKTHL